MCFYFKIHYRFSAVQLFLAKKLVREFNVKIECRRFYYFYIFRQ